MAIDEPHAEGNEIETRWDGSVPVVHLTGSLDARMRALLETELSLACAVPGDIVVDVAQVAEADPVGVAPVVATARALRSQGSHLVVRGAAPTLQRLIEMLDPTEAVSHSDPPPTSTPEAP